MNGKDNAVAACIAFARAYLHVWLTHAWLIVETSIRVMRPLDCVRPRSVEEKFLWRKIFDRNPLFVVACDKLAARDYALSRFPELKAAPVLWSGEDANDIPDALLSGDAVFKANSGSGMAVLVQDNRPDRRELKALGQRWLATPYGRKKGEWGYAPGRRLLLLERMLKLEGRPVDHEYKFHVAAGRTAYVIVKLGTPTLGKTFLVLNRDGRTWTAPSKGKGEPLPFRPPEAFIEMRTLSERLAAEFDFVRVDLYLADDGINFSELTIYPSSGYGHIGNDDLAQLRNRMWDLRDSWFMTTPQSGWRAAYAAALRRFLDFGTH